ncbi:hypothetical protein ACF1FC_11235 [Streptomyces sp. NPDC014344]|uniref:hypothetical protein n=1 Tax=Streptomyces sp. NPDC014344 TaxID=3364871 RepID=UPI0036FB6242
MLLFHARRHGHHGRASPPSSVTLTVTDVVTGSRPPTASAGSSQDRAVSRT